MTIRELNSMKRKIITLLFMVLSISICFASTEAAAREFYIDSSLGSDSNSGLDTNVPWKSLANIKSKSFSPGDTMFLKKGQSWNEVLTLSDSGSQDNRITIDSYGSGALPVIKEVYLSGAYVTIQNLVVDHQKNDSDAFRLRDVDHAVLRNIEIRNGLRDGIDIARARNLTIESLHIHHFLAGSFTNQVDAHGIVMTESQNITIRNTEIHHVSGDTIQVDPERDSSNLSNNISVEGCHLWTSPLTETFNTGWIKTDHLPDSSKQYPGENAIDTKVLKEGWENYPPMKMTIKGLVAHGWKDDGYISNKAALNLKENVDVTIDGAVIYDCEIGLRLRGTRGNADVNATNLSVYDCKIAIRAEDNLKNLSVTNSTFGYEVGDHLQMVGDSGGSDTWNFKDNLFVGSLPDEVVDPSNLIVTGTSQETGSTGSITLAWTPNSESDLAGYQIYYGTSSRDYGTPISVGKISSYTISNLEIYKTYYFALTAIDFSGNESGISAEITGTIESTDDSDGSTPSSDELVVSNLKTSSKYVYSVVPNLETGSKAYVDNDVYYTVLPDYLLGLTYIKTAKYDRYVSDLSMSFTVNQDVKVYIAYYSRASIPIWLQGFTKTNDTLTADRTMALYSKEFKAGEIKLGRNYANAMYTVILEGLSNAGTDPDPGDGDTVQLPAIEITPPSLSILSPTGGTVYNADVSDISVTGKANDASGIMYVTWSNSAGSGGVAQGKENWSISNLPLGAGENIVTISVFDMYGNKTVSQLKIAQEITDTDSTPPELIITSPVLTESVVITDSSIDIKGNAADNKSVAKVIWFSTNGDGGSATGLESWTIYDVPLVFGENTVTVTAIDESGNQTAQKITITRGKTDNAPPVLEVVSPFAGTSYKSEFPTIDLAGKAFDDNGVVSVSWYKFDGESGSNIGAETWNIPGVRLYEGDNTIVVTAVDQAGNEGVLTLNINYTRKATSLSITNLEVSSGKTYVVKDDLSLFDRAYTDNRRRRYLDLPNYLVGAKYIQTAHRDRYKSKNQIRFTVDRDVRVYIAYYDKMSPVRDWLKDGFVNTGNTLRTHKRMTIYSKDFNAGEIVLGENYSRAMYTIIITGN